MRGAKHIIATLVGFSAIDPAILALTAGTAQAAPPAFELRINGAAGDGLDTGATGSVSGGAQPWDRPSAPVDIETVFDGLDTKPVLNIAPVGGGAVIPRGERVSVRAIWNYSAFIAHGEVRVFARGAPLDGEPLQVVPLDAQRQAVIDTGAPGLPDELVYLVRVYGKDMRFDETRPRVLTIGETANRFSLDAEPVEPVIGPGDVEDFARIRNIRVSGASVTVRGVNVAPGEEVAVLGTSVGVAPDGSFVAREIVPFGDQTIPVEIKNGRDRLIEREVHVPLSEWFVVGHGEVTIGRNISDRKQYGSGSLDVLGKGGLYLKGKVKGEYLITASIDTEEDEPGRLLSNVVERKRNGLLNRIDPDKYYPVFGDSSSTLDDAPSQSNLYVRIDRGDDHVMWGSYDVNIREAELVELSRGLYGAKAVHKSDALTSRGEARTEAVVYAAALDTAANNEMMTGTGGTVYRFSRQDVVEGSVRLQIEVRNRTSGVIVDTVSLTEGRDYTVDHVQGRVLLARPLLARLQSENANPGLNDTVVLAARYEYRPTVVDVDGYTVAGRVSHWVTDSMRVGATGQIERSDTERQQIAAADLLLRHSANTWLKAEFARSKGPARVFVETIDGGLTSLSPIVPGSSVDADAYRVDAAIDFSDFSAIRGSASAFYEHYDRGYAGKTRSSVNRAENWGAAVVLGDENGSNVALNYDETRVENEGQKGLVSVKSTLALDEANKASLGATHDWVMRGSTFSANGLEPQANRYGGRTDMTLRLDHDSGAGWSGYTFGTATVQRSGTRRRNDRAGVGGRVELGKDLTVGGEISYGTGGVGGEVELVYAKDDAEIALGYSYVNNVEQLPELGGIGTRNAHSMRYRGTRKVSENLSYFSETSVGLQRGLGFGDNTNTFGAEFRPHERWTVTAMADTGLLNDSYNDVYRRMSGSIGVDYDGERLDISSALESRLDRGRGRDASFLAGRFGVTYKADNDWTMRVALDATLSQGVSTSLQDGEYLKVTAAGAYRPVENDQLNALFKYVFLHDLAPLGQIGSNGYSATPAQRSHVVSADFSYEMNGHLTVGGKYAGRVSEIAMSREHGDFVRNAAHLGVGRIDVRVLGDWSLMLEGRMFDIEDSGVEFGSLLGVWYDLNDNVKLGGGYSFSRYSDDLTDMSADHEGWFINVASQF